MIINSAYIVCAVSREFRFLHTEEMFFYKQVLSENAKDEGKWLEVEFILVERELTKREQRRRSRLLSLVKGKKFDLVVFRGDSVPPYVAALRKMAYPHTEVLNNAEKDSSLDFYLQMFDYDREKSALG